MIDGVKKSRKHQRSLKTSYLSLMMGVEESEREDDEELKVEACEDMGPLELDIITPIEKPIVWRFPRVMVLMRPNETLLEPCLV